MRAAEPRLSPPTVAALPGFEARKLLQRFAQLDAGNQVRLLDMAAGMIEHQHDAKLPPRERQAKQLIDRIERCLELLATEGGDCRIKTAIWRGMVDDDKAELAALGVGYFGAAAVSRRAA